MGFVLLQPVHFRGRYGDDRFLRGEPACALAGGSLPHCSARSCGCGCDMEVRSLPPCCLLRGSRALVFQGRDVLHRFTHRVSLGGKRLERHCGYGRVQFGGLDVAVAVFPRFVGRDARVCRAMREEAPRGCRGCGWCALGLVCRANSAQMWMALSLLFFAALFGGFLEGSYIFSGNIVVAVRSMLDVLLWVTLCGFSYAKKASPILMFSVFGIPTDVASWALSYVAVPDALDAWADGGFAQALDALALLAAFASLVSVVVVLGWSLTRGSLSAGFIEGAEESVFPKSHADQSDVRSLRLTEREAEVASLFARGHSVKKVASLLFISTSTVQSHMKSVYRKLGVHSRDELKEKLSGR